ncbi:hypothetical protein Tco_0070922 [Tanacetum coccineum]
MGNVKKSVAERTRHQRQYARRVNKRQLQMQESKIDTGKAVAKALVVTESSGTESEVQDDNSRPGNDIDADDADIRPIYDEEPMDEVQLTAECNIFAIGQQHTEQPEIIMKVGLTITQHYFPMRRESISAKPDHMIASSESRDSSKNMPRFSSNDMIHNHYLDEARKKTQERDRNSKTNVIPFARFQSTAVGSKPKPKSTNHLTRSLPISKSSCVTIMATPKADHFKSSSSFSDSKHFSMVAEKANISETSATVDSQMLKKNDPRTTMSTKVPTADMIELESLFGPLFDEYFNGENQVVSKSSAVTTADASDKRQQQPDSASSSNDCHCWRKL